MAISHGTGEAPEKHRVVFCKIFSQPPYEGETNEEKIRKV
jgi:hypothetical protein